MNYSNLDRAFERILNLPPDELDRLARECAEEAKRRSDEYDAKIRVEPWMWDVRVTV